MSANRREQRKMKSIVFENLDRIYSTSLSIAKDFGSFSIPENLLTEIINKSKVSISTKIDVVNTHNKQFNKTLDSLLKGCIEVAKNIESKNIPLSSIKQGVGIIKTAYGGDVTKAEVMAASYGSIITSKVKILINAREKRKNDKRISKINKRISEIDEINDLIK